MRPLRLEKINIDYAVNEAISNGKQDFASMRTAPLPTAGFLLPWVFFYIDSDIDMDNIDLWESLLEGSKRKTIVMEEGQRKIMDCDVHCDRPQLGKIVVLPLAALPNFSYPKPWATISIVDAEWFYNGKAPQISDENRVDMLRLGFDDIEFERRTGGALFTNEQALQIWDFIVPLWDQIDLLMVHCFAGISRSTAIAKAISDRFQPKFSDYYDQLYMPNPLVYKRMLVNEPTRSDS